MRVVSPRDVSLIAAFVFAAMKKNNKWSLERARDKFTEYTQGITDPYVLETAEAVIRKKYGLPPLRYKR
jgi:hypothetical protein